MNKYQPRLQPGDRARWQRNTLAGLSRFDGRVERVLKPYESAWAHIPEKRDRMGLNDYSQNPRYIVRLEDGRLVVPRAAVVDRAVAELAEVAHGDL